MQCTECLASLEKRVPPEVWATLRILAEDNTLGWDDHQLQGLAVSKDLLTVWKTSPTGFGGAVGSRLYSSGISFLSSADPQQAATLLLSK